jgi:Putative MetA-pathway of phenol degradation
MKMLITSALLASAVLLQAQVIPGINSKAGATVLPEGKLKMGIKYIQMKRDSMYKGSNEVTNVQNLDATARVTLLGLRYGLTNNLNLALIVPYKELDATASLAGNDVAVKNSGLGDIIVMGRYALLLMQKYGFGISIDAGVKLPTGSTEDGFKKAPAFATGENTPLPTQMGTGKAEYKIGLGFSKVFENNMRIDAHTMYTYRPLAENNYDLGNELSYDLGFIAGLTKNINLGVEYNGKYNSSTDMGSDTNPILQQALPFKAFSGTVGYITPQIQFLPFDKPKLHIDFGISFLAHYNVSEYQPLEKERFILRLGYLF